MKAFIIYITIISFALQTDGQKIKYNIIISDAEKQTQVMLDAIAQKKNVVNNPALVSPRTLEKEELKLVPAKDWTSGFFPGQLWLLYELTGKETWKQQAEAFTKSIESQQFDPTTHDLGFKIYCSIGTGYKLTEDTHYKAVIIQAAKTLSRRFNAATGTIKSWDNTKKWAYPVIIDNMMNLELLFEATKLSGDSSFYHIAVTHANTTMKNHFRGDYSSYHVVDYDTTGPGKVIKKTTHQGYADESAWSRGQAWGLYGYTMCYRETKNIAYLRQAEKIAAYIFNNPDMPKDLVPYWDFNAPSIPNEERDVSAATVMASALYELSLYSDNKKSYLSNADKILKNVIAAYRAPIGSSKGFLLLHSTGSKPGGFEIDAPLSYADYYYMEAIARSKKLKNKKPLF
ncbi:glycoside hydrolase family 88 protein [Ferruginibacter sp. HRS2-29]|uniref:glycoside hydrolase family 88 protein n=1 Tax=Ferruginibacter sp. HRS2-29 TaxID=2487334 RepID=UPI0020CF4CB5|nr:glycoside hydrolase family 88 protein [Ferruginibacter sp. HRS2-29]MCP9749396.1 glucuronyl hydrolase [Ferruginibacter sp. HRS2-29]